MLDGDGRRVGLAVGPDGEAAIDGDATGWHPTITDAAKLITRSIRFTRSLSNHLAATASHLDESQVLVVDAIVAVKLEVAHLIWSRMTAPGRG